MLDCSKPVEVHNDEERRWSEPGYAILSARVIWMFAPQSTLREIFGWALKRALLMKLGAGEDIYVRGRSDAVQKDER